MLCEQQNELFHYGVLGMKWGKRKNYSSTSVGAAIARRKNEKIDKSFDKWKEGSANKEKAIELGKKANTAKREYENDKSNKQLKNDYQQANKAYKKALSKNTTYRKGAVRQEVGKDMSRKYLSEAKKTKKLLDADPSNKQLKKKYNSLMSKHDVERAKARKAASVGAKRSAKKAAIKRVMTMTIKTAAATTAVAAGSYAVNRYLSSRDVRFNGKPIRLGGKNINDIAGVVRKIKDFLKYAY